MLSKKKYDFLLFTFTLTIILPLALSACTTEGNSLDPMDIPTQITAVSNPSTKSRERNADSLDLREANVVAVTFKALGEGVVRFHVTLHHDDDGEAPNYADYWLVEDKEGNILGKRILTHSHSSEPFTRSETISIPEKTSIVIVRGHDMYHGFGGQAMRLDLKTGQAEPFIENEVPD